MLNIASNSYSVLVWVSLTPNHKNWYQRFRRCTISWSSELKAYEVHWIWLTLIDQLIKWLCWSFHYQSWHSITLLDGEFNFLQSAIAVKKAYNPKMCYWILTSSVNLIKLHNVWWNSFYLQPSLILQYILSRGFLDWIEIKN